MGISITIYKGCQEQAGNMIISKEPNKQCEYCGKVAETRPYGRNNEEICFECGMRDEKTTKRQFHNIHG